MNFNFEKYGKEIMNILESSMPKITAALIILAVGWWLSNQAARLMYRGMRRSKADTGIVTFISSLTRTLLKIIVCITAAAELGMNISSIIAALGAAGLTIGLALKDSMSNIASGAQIIFTKPFHVGDYLSVGDVEGIVERIEIIFTSLKTFDNKKIVIPNSKITSSVITNYTAMETRRLSLNYQVGYDEDVNHVKEILDEIVNNNKMILKQPEPLIVVEEYGSGTLTISAKLWCNTNDYWDLYYDMQEKVKSEFEKAGIQGPRQSLNLNVKPRA